MLLSIDVYANFEDKKIKCRVLNSFEHKITQRSYVIVFSPFETTPETVIPLLFDPEIDAQEAYFLTDEQDISVIEEVVNKNVCQIQYLPTNMTFDIQISRPSNDEIEEYLKKVASARLGLPFPKADIDELIKNIDAKIIHLTGQEYFSELKDRSAEHSGIVTGLIMEMLKQDVLLTHIPLNIVDQLLVSESMTITIQERHLLRAFQDIIIVLGKSEIISQEVENSLVALIECEICTEELYHKIIQHKTFSENISRDVLNNIKYNVVRRSSCFFDLKTIKEAANYYYSQKEFSNALDLFKVLYQKLNNMDSDEQELAITLNSIGCCCVSLMRFGEAYDAFKRATNIDDNFAAAYNNWAYTLSIEADTISNENKRRDKLQDALVHINDAIQVNANDISFISNRAFIEYELGQYEHVIKDYSRAKEKSTEYADISTILKLKINSKLKLHINFPSQHLLSFSDLYSDLRTIFNNETGRDRIYFEALDVFDEISNNEDAETANKILLDLVLLEFYINELMSAITVRNPNQEIYYYTSMGSIYRLLSDDKTTIKHRLPIFGANHMNDPSEGQELERTFLLRSVSKKFLKDLFSHPDKTPNTKRRHLEAEFTFLKAFTKNDDSLPMWVHYADSGKGCCVKVNPHFFTNFDNDPLENDKTLKTNPFDNEYRLYEVLYIDNGEIVNNVSQTVKDMFQNMLNKASELSNIYEKLTKKTQKAVAMSMAKMITKLKYLFKSADYAYEQEMRIVLRRPLDDLKRDDIDIQMTSPTSDNPIPKVFVYTNKGLTVEEIILGPKVIETDNLIPFITMKLLELNNFNAEKVNITKSGIEYR